MITLPNDEGYYLGKMHGDINDSDVTVLYFDGKALYSFGSFKPVLPDDLVELIPEPLNLDTDYMAKRTAFMEAKAATPFMLMPATLQRALDEAFESNDLHAKTKRDLLEMLLSGATNGSEFNLGPATSRAYEEVKIWMEAPHDKFEGDAYDRIAGDMKAALTHFAIDRLSVYDLSIKVLYYSDREDEAIERAVRALLNFVHMGQPLREIAETLLVPEEALTTLKQWQDDTAETSTPKPGL